MKICELVLFGFRPWLASASSVENSAGFIWKVAVGKIAYALIPPGKSLHPANACLRTAEYDTWQEAEADLISQADEYGTPEGLHEASKQGRLEPIDWSGTGVMHSVAIQRQAAEVIIKQQKKKAKRKASR